MRQVAALFVRADSVYKTMPGVDAWDIERDARAWPGGCPVVAHPPCRLWASLRTKSKAPIEEKELAHFAIAMVRKHGGVVEHPWLSTLWDEYGLRGEGGRGKFTVGMARRDKFGFLLPIDLFAFGFPAKKRTGLYICGIEPQTMPPAPYRLGEPTHTIGLWSGRDRATCKPSIPKAMFDQTPREMAEWLVELARRVRTEHLEAA